jgi:hypothetical protein
MLTCLIDVLTTADDFGGMQWGKQAKLYIWTSQRLFYDAGTGATVWWVCSLDDLETQLQLLQIKDHSPGAFISIWALPLLLSIWALGGTNCSCWQKWGSDLINHK